VPLRDARLIRSVHVVARGCGAAIENHGALVAAVRVALEQAGATIMGDVHHFFVPHGMTIVAIAAESHLALSTWPELKAAVAEIVLCGASADPMRAWHHLEMVLTPSEMDLEERLRLLKPADQPLQGKGRG